MFSRASGDYLVYDIDWEKSVVHLREAGGILRGKVPNGTFPITSTIRAVKEVADARGGGSGPVRIIADILYEGDIVSYTLHCTNDFGSVVNVQRSLIAKLLGSILTPREIEVTVELFEGCTIRCIAATLHIAEGTVKRTIHNIYSKMNVCSQVELIREIYVRIAQHAALEELNNDAD